MTPHVMKRDGCKVPFNSERITKAQFCVQLKQRESMTQTIAPPSAEVVSQQMQGRAQVDINEIQTAVENRLMSGPYSSWRAPTLSIAMTAIASVRSAAVSIRRSAASSSRPTPRCSTKTPTRTVQVVPTPSDLLAGIVAKRYTSSACHDVVMAHQRGMIHYHDLDYSPFFPMFNCMLIDLKGMLTQGFKMGNAEIEPPKSISTATAVTAQIIAQVASHIYSSAPSSTASMKCWRRSSAKTLKSITKSPKSCTDPGCRRLCPRPYRKRVLRRLPVAGV